MSLDTNDGPALPRAVVDVLRRDEPEPEVVQAAYRRYALRRPEPVSMRHVVRWLAVGFVAGSSAAFAATGTAQWRNRIWGSAELLARGPQTSPTVTNRRLPRVSAPAAPSDAPPSSSATPLPEPHDDPPHALGESSRVVLPAPLATDPEWQRAATALKRQDLTAAEAALRGVETTGTASDRDAASLALAQVLLTRGRLVEARARLERLSKSSGSATVREKATALLAQLSSSVERSIPAPLVPQ